LAELHAEAASTVIAYWIDEQIAGIQVIFPLHHNTVLIFKQNQ
jgi:hypothetical protein